MAKAKLNIPNRITLIRFVGSLALFILVYVGLFGIGGQVPTTHFTYLDLFCFVLFILLASTDGIDGHIARSRNLVTDLGKFMDPLADKILVDGSLILLTIRDPLLLPPAFTVLLVGRDFVVDGFRMVAASKGKVVPADIYGKAKTLMEMIYIPILFLGGFPVSYVDWAVDADAFGAFWQRTSIWDYSGELWAMVFCLVLGFATVCMSLISGIRYLYIGREFFRDQGGHGDGK